MVFYFSCVTLYFPLLISLTIPPYKKEAAFRPLLLIRTIKLFTPLRGLDEQLF